MSLEIAYQDWTGIGYLKENLSTGEAGYMLSGMIAGGMTAINKDKWINQDLANILSYPYSKKQNPSPEEAVKIVRLNKDSGDYQSAIVGTILKTPFEVLALDGMGSPVQNVKITFKAISGGGKVQGVNKNGNPINDINTGVSTPAPEITIRTGSDGIARAKLTLGEQTSSSPYYRKYSDSDNRQYWEKVGLNLVSVTASTSQKSFSTDKPFETYGRPGEAKEMIKLSPTTDIYGPPGIFVSSLWIKIVDQYGNPVSGKTVKYKVTREYLGTPPATGAVNAKLFSSLADCPGVATIDCPNAKEADTAPFETRTEHFGAQPYLITGNTENTKFTITVTANKDYFDNKGMRIDDQTALNSVSFTFYTKTVENGYVSVYTPYATDEKGNKTDAGNAGEIYPQPLTAAMFYTEKTKDGTFSVMPVTKNPPAGSPLKNDAKMEFKVYAGGGSTEPVTQTVEKNGNYSTTLKLGDIPGKNTIKAIGTVTASVPSYDAQGNVTRTDKTLSAYFPIEIWGVKARVEVDQPIFINNEGYEVG